MEEREIYEPMLEEPIKLIDCDFLSRVYLKRKVLVLRVNGLNLVIDLGGNRYRFSATADYQILIDIETGQVLNGTDVFHFTSMQYETFYEFMEASRSRDLHTPKKLQISVLHLVKNCQGMADYIVKKLRAHNVEIHSQITDTLQPISDPTSNHSLVKTHASNLVKQMELIQKIDYALDTNNKKEFITLTKKLNKLEETMQCLESENT